MVSTKTLLLKHYYRRQGMGFWRLFGPFSRPFADFWDPGPESFSRRLGDFLAFGPETPSPRSTEPQDMRDPDVRVYSGHDRDVPRFGLGRPRIWVLTWGMWRSVPPRKIRGPKKHINFFNINFLAPTQNTPFWAPRKKFMCLISCERTQKRDPHKLFWGGFGVKKGGPKRAIFGHKKFSLLFFPALTDYPPKFF